MVAATGPGRLGGLLGTDLIGDMKMKKTVMAFAVATAVIGMLAGCGEDNRKITDAEYKEMRKHFCSNKEEAKQEVEKASCKDLTTRQLVMPETHKEGRCLAAHDAINGLACGGGFKINPGSGQRF